MDTHTRVAYAMVGRVISRPDIKFIHYRFVRNGSSKPELVPFNRKDHAEKPESRGGMTVCKILVDGLIFVGFAHCSDKDQFCYRTGRKLALARAGSKLIEAGYVLALGEKDFCIPTGIALDVTLPNGGFSI